MPTYQITVDGVTFTVEVPETLASPATVVVDGRPVSVDWHRLSPASTGASRQLENSSAPALPASTGASRQLENSSAPALPASTGASRQLEKPATPTAAALPSPASASAPVNAILAPMPGKVLAVKVAAGDEIVYGQELLVLEAMKMAQSIRSSQAGVIAAVHVAANDSVRQGQALVTFK